MIDLALLILRVSIGSMLLFGHGWGKLAHFGSIAPQFADPLGTGPQVALALAVFAEVFCSAGVIFGVLTRFACIPPLITMAVAITVVHAEDPWQKKELAVLYAIPFLVLILSGGGKFSFDRLILRRG